MSQTCFIFTARIWATIFINICNCPRVNKGAMIRGVFLRHVSFVPTLKPWVDRGPIWTPDIMTRCGHINHCASDNLKRVKIYNLYPFFNTYTVTYRIRHSWRLALLWKENPGQRTDIQALSQVSWCRAYDSTFTVSQGSRSGLGGPERYPWSVWRYWQKQYQADISNSDKRRFWTRDPEFLSIICNKWPPNVDVVLWHV